MKNSIPDAARSKPVEIWFQDEARVGQQGTLTRLWVRCGTRPRVVRDTRYEWAYLFGAVCPERAVGAALVMPYANTEAMNLHLQEIAAAVAPGAHAVLVVDGAGWARRNRPRPASQPLHRDPAAILTRTEPGRKRLGIPTQEQTRQPNVRKLPPDRRRLLPGME